MSERALAAATDERPQGSLSRAARATVVGDGSRDSRATAHCLKLVKQIDRGDIFWIAPDDSRGPVPDYSHPHVVVQEGVFNHSRIATVVVCALTTNLNKASEPGNVLLDVGEGNLPQQSVVVVSQILSVDKVRLGERLGALSDARVEQILTGLRFLQVSFFRR